ncbi:MAG: hypothetical protein GY774_33855 [Planctomycetes bacterium]|nr:hypothetical protein [Planctomycetota bacterium]
MKKEEHPLYRGFVESRIKMHDTRPATERDFQMWLEGIRFLTRQLHSGEAEKHEIPGEIGNTVMMAVHADRESTASSLLAICKERLPTDSRGRVLLTSVESEIQGYFDLVANRK